MFENMENLELIDIMRKPASKYREFKSRFSHGFVFKISGESIYHFDNEKIIHRAGELLFIPKGEKYTLRCLCKDSEYLLINFDAVNITPCVRKYSLNNYFEADYLYDNLESLWLMGGTVGRYKCLSIFYDIISYVSHQQNIDNSPKRNFAKISPAVKYLEKHIFDSDLRVENLYVLCNISDTHFRKLFKAHYSMNPAEYIKEKRLSRARFILESGDYESISEVANMAGFDDPLYFSKIFKAKYNVPPSAYRTID